jgi:hypothetical protein
MLALTGGHTGGSIIGVIPARCVHFIGARGARLSDRGLGLPRFL